MDTAEEIVRDKWVQDHLRMCGTCEHKGYGICRNADSYLCGELVGSTDMCDEWSMRDEARTISDQRRKTYEKLKGILSNGKEVISCNDRNEK